MARLALAVALVLASAAAQAPGACGGALQTRCAPGYCCSQYGYW